MRNFPHRPYPANPGRTLPTGYGKDVGGGEHPPDEREKAKENKATKEPYGENSPPLSEDIAAFVCVTALLRRSVHDAFKKKINRRLRYMKCGKLSYMKCAKFAHLTAADGALIERDACKAVTGRIQPLVVFSLAQPPHLHHHSLVPVRGQTQGVMMTDNNHGVPTRVRIASVDLPRWAAVREHIRNDLESRPSVHRVENPADTRIMGEMLLTLMMHYRMPDPLIHYGDVPANAEEASADLDNLGVLMKKYMELGHRVEAHMNRVLGPAKDETADAT